MEGEGRKNERWKASRGTTNAKKRPSSGKRWEEVTYRQLLTGSCPILRETLFKIGRADSPNCTVCGGLDDVRHVLEECSQGTGLREFVFGLNPTMEAMLEEPNKVLKLLRGMGRLATPSISAAGAAGN